MSLARIGLDNPGFEGRLRYQNRGSSYIRRSVVTGDAESQVFDVTPRLNRTKPIRPVVESVHASIQAEPTRSVLAVPAQPVSSSSPRQFTPPRSIAKMRRKKLSIAKLRGVSRQALVLYVMAGILFLGGGAVALNGLLVNRHVAAQVRTITQSASGATAGDPNSPNQPGAPSAVKPTAAAVRNYAVSPNMPRYIDVPRFNDHARVISVGTLPSGALATPSNIYDIGWYNGSSLPGEPGAMLLAGHVSSWTAHGTFYNLKKLVKGDTIKIQRGDGKKFTYKVVNSKTYDHKHVDMKRAVRSADPSKPGLNLITCTGKVIPGTNEFDKRLVVFAVQQ